MSQLYRDPWAKREAWRKHPVFSNRVMFANLFPGFGIALVAFGAYVLADNLIHPDNIEELKKTAKANAERPSLMTIFKGNAPKKQEHEQQQQQQ